MVELRSIVLEGLTQKDMITAHGKVVIDGKTLEAPIQNPALQMHSVPLSSVDHHIREVAQKPTLASSSPPPPSFNVNLTESREKVKE